MKRLFIVAVVCTASLATGGVAASDAAAGQPLRLAVLATDVAFGPPGAACDGAIFQVDYVLRSPAGQSVGAGRNCVLTIRGCEPFRVGCTQNVTALVTLELGGGTVTFRAAFRETFVSENTIVQIVHGRVISATGVYAGATGRLLGGGTATFLPDGSVVPRIVYLVVGRLGH